MDQPAENKVIEEISFDARVDYDVDELRSEDGAESRRFRSGSMDREEEPGQEDYRPRQLRNYKNDDEHEGSEFGRFEISDGEGDDEYRSKGLSARVLYIHGLNRQANEKELKERFSAYGTITALHIPLRPYDRTPKGFGFIRMSKPEEATAAIEGEDRKTFMGVAIEVVRAKRGGEREQRGERRHFSRSSSYNHSGPIASGYGREERFGGYHRETSRREFSPERGRMDRGGPMPPQRFPVRDDYIDGPRGPPPPRYAPPPPASRPYDRYPEYERRQPYPPARPAYPSGGAGAPPPGYDYPSPPQRYPHPPAPRRDYPPPASGAYYDEPYRRGLPPSGPPQTGYYPGPPPLSYGGGRAPPPSGRRYDGPPPSGAYGPYDGAGRPSGPYDQGRRPPPPANGPGGNSRNRTPPRY